MAHISVSSVRADVFDLSVADCHEFVADGVVVHNCVWALTDLMLDQRDVSVEQYRPLARETRIVRGDLVLIGDHHIDR